jgi:Xaa-Pro aminopeptidase
MAPHTPYSPNRIRGLQQALRDAGIDAALINYSRSLLYYAGTTQPSFLIITPEDHHLLVFRGLDAAREEGRLAPEQMSQATNPHDLERVLEEMGIRSPCLGMELDIIPTRQYRQVSERFPHSRIEDISGLILRQRTIKDAQEIQYTREACRVLHHGHERILEVLKPGMTELELSAEIEDAHRKAGHEGLYFIRQFDFFMGRGPLASGENLTRIAGRIQSITGAGLSPSIPMGASRKRIQAGEAVVVDIPTHCQGYHCDQSRTYVAGTAGQGCANLHGAMREIADRVIDAVRPGMTCGQTYDVAAACARKLGVEPHFMRLGGGAGSVPFVGHGIGLELNEPPLISRGSSEPLEEGMTLALELEMCGPNEEVVKLEDTLLVTAHGAEILTVTPRELFQV